MVVIPMQNFILSGRLLAYGTFPTLRAESSEVRQSALTVGTSDVESSSSHGVSRIV